MQEYITHVKNTDQYLYEFIFIKDLLNLTQINRSMNKLVQKLTIVEQYSGFKLSEGVRLLVDFACANNYIELLNNIYDFDDKFNYTSLATSEAAKYGRTKIFEWFKIKKIIIHNENYAYYRMNIYALKNNRIDVIEWLEKNKRKTYDNMTDIQNLKSINDKIRISCSYNMVDYLNKLNNLELALFNKYFEDDDNGYVNKSIINEGNIEILEWLHNNNYVQYLEKNLSKSIEIATDRNRHSVIKWFNDHKYC